LRIRNPQSGFFHSSKRVLNIVTIRVPVDAPVEQLIASEKNGRPSNRSFLGY
jgi:hypothetical protein